MALTSASTMLRSCYAPDAAPRRLYVRFGCFAEYTDEFDSAAFRLSYMEAAAMDPQCRILLEQTAVRCTAAAVTIVLCLIPLQLQKIDIVGVRAPLVY